MYIIPLPLGKFPIHVLFTTKPLLSKIKSPQKPPRNGTREKTRARRPRPCQRPLPRWHDPICPSPLSRLSLATLPPTLQFQNRRGSLFGFTPYYACIATMVLTASAHHVFWQLYISEQVMPTSFALIVCTFNTVMNASNVGMSLWGLASNAPAVQNSILWGSWTRVLGLGMFYLGSFVETFANLQRKMFKDQPVNKGKVYMGGLFGMARHINFGGYLIWRTGFAIFGGGLPWGTVIVSYFLWYFSNVGVPALDAYCSERVRNTYSVPRLLP